MSTGFSRTLALLRQEKKISQRLAASELGISQALLSHYEKGVREPGLEFVVKSAKYYNVSTDYLLGLTMSRDGSGVLSANELHDISVDKDNSMRGNLLATLNKKLIVNSVGLIYDILGKCSSRPLINEASEYLSLTVYKLFRYLYRAGGRSTEHFFSVPDRAFERTVDAEQKLCELRMCSLLENDPVEAYEDNSIPTVPEITNEFIETNYPQLAQSLMTVLQKTGEKLQYSETQK